jgi:phosphomannomutase/phosphoglucomutase
MKITASKPEKTNKTANKMAIKIVDPRIKPMVINVIVAAAVGIGSYLTTQHVVEQQQNQALTEFGRNAAVIIDRQIDNWEAESNLLAQQPSLKSTGHVKAIIGLDGAVPTDLSFADQDLLNRTHQAPTGAEISNIGANALITTAVAMPVGGYLISVRPFSVLSDDLKKITSTSNQLTLSQTFKGGQPLNALTLNSDTTTNLINVPLKAVGWQLSVGRVSSRSLSPLTNLPLLAGLLAFIASLLSMCIWFFIKPKRIIVPPTQLSSEDQLAHLDAIALELASPQPEVEVEVELKSEPEPTVPAPLNTTQPTMTAEPVQTNIVQEPVPEVSIVIPAPISDIDLDDLSYLDDALAPPKPPEPPQTNLMEFTLGSGALLPETEFYLDKGLPKHIFRAYDIRGKVTDLTAEWMKPIARALGSELRARGQIEVVVGFDARTTSEHYAEIMRNGLVESGLQVIDIGMIPTPVMHYAARQHQGNGIMITASHNPAEYNGVKWLMQQESPLPDDIEAIYKRAQGQSFTEGKGKLRTISYTAEYLDDMLNDVILSDELNVVIDGMNGVMGELAQQAIQTAGCTVIDLDIKPDGSYPHGNPDPCEPNRLNELSQQMVISQADIGFAFDGDGDRMVAVTKDGQVVTSDQLISLFAMMILESKPGADIVFDVKCSRMVSQTITANGGRPIMSRSGNTFIRHAVMSDSHEVAFGGEFSGHYFFNDGRGHASDDGLYAALRLMEWLGQRGQSLEEVLQTLPTRVGTPDIYIPLDTDLTENFFSELAIDATLVEGATLTTIDGVRLDFQNGFGIIRASNTGAFATMRFEAENEMTLQHIRQVFHDLVKNHLPSLAEKIQV